jgi:hypothetical protein
MKESGDAEIVNSVRLAVRQRKRELPNAAGGVPIAAGGIGTYVWGTRLRFGIGGQAREFMTTGWSHDEAGNVWTEGNRASIAMRISPPGGDIRLSLCVKALAPFDGRRQTLRLRSNAHVDLNWLVSGDFSWVRGRLFFQQVSGLKELLIDLIPESPVAPLSVGQGDDPRLLGVAVAELILETE